MLRRRPFSAIVLSTSFAALALAACSASPPQSGIDADGDKLADDLGTWVGSGAVGDPFDVNMDGTFDGPGVDTNGDGIADAAALDLDGDGIYDALDTTGDGQPNRRTGISDEPGSIGDSTGGTGGGGAGLMVKIEEPVFVPPPDCDNTLEIIVRDFDRSHPDFGGVERAGGGDPFIGDEVRRQLVQPDLGPGKKPVFKDSMGCAAPEGNLVEPVDNCANWTISQGAITTAENFSEWYKDTPDKNFTFDKTLELVDQGGGVYVYDTDAFFPLSIDEGFGETMGTAADNVTPGKNFLFTTEIHLQFDYVAGQKFTFRGDDDLWVFINGKLALDLGSMHAPKSSTIDFDKQKDALGIEVGKAYPMDIFHAERRWNGSNFRIETNISCFVPVTEGVVR